MSQKLLRPWWKRRRQLSRSTRQKMSIHVTCVYETTDRKLAPELGFVAKFSEYCIICIACWSGVVLDASNIEAGFGLFLADRHAELARKKNWAYERLVYGKYITVKLKIRVWEEMTRQVIRAYCWHIDGISLIFITTWMTVACKPNVNSHWQISVY